MDKSSFFIANANNQLTRQKKSIEKSFRKAITTRNKLLGSNPVDVIFMPDAKRVIPEIGIGGYTPSQHLIYIYIDPDRDIDENELYYTLCHEMNHAVRYKGQGYGKTLFDSMIFEGLAVCFEEEASGGKAFMGQFMKEQSDTEELVRNVASNFNDKEFNHFQWFIEDKSRKLPRWTGYRVGYYIVNNYLQKNKKRASELVLEDSLIFSRSLID